MTALLGPLAWVPFINPLYSAIPHLTAIWLLLIFPLVVFIFPTTFIILAFPIFMMVKQQGL